MSAAGVEALRLAEEHGLPVFPCWEFDHARNKHGEPIGKKSPRTSRGFLDATCNREQIAEWWRRWPDALVGVPTGAVSGLFVVDVDDKGHDWYATHAESLAAGRVHKTIRGWHCLYRATGLPTTASSIAAGIDTRGEGGYIIWWPAAGLPCTGEIEEIGPAPAWLSERLAAHASKPAASPATPASTHPDRSRDLLAQVGRAVRDGLTDAEIIERHRDHPHAIDQTDPVRAVERCIRKARTDRATSATPDDSAPDSHVDRCAAAMLADLNAGPEAVRAAKPPDFVVDQIIPACGGNLAASGGTSKTTLAIIEAVHVIAGGRLYGREVIRQAPCIFVTAEDGADYGRYLLQRIVADGLAQGAISERVKAWAEAEIRFIAWPRSTFGPIANVDRDGNLFRSAMFDRLLEIVAPLNPAMVTLDPLALLGPGERFGNDADAFVAAMAHEAARELGAFVQYVDHVAQSVARGGIVDQYAARGGSAKTDNARLARQLVRVDSQDAPGMPASVTTEDVERRRILQLHWTKSNYAPLPPMQWLRRRGFWIETLRATSTQEAQEARAADRLRERAADVELVLQAISEARARGDFPTARRVEDIGVIDERGEPLPRQRIRAAIATATADGRLRLAPLPVELRQGARRDYLDVRAAA